MKKNNFKILFGSIAGILLFTGLCYAKPDKNEKAFANLLAETNTFFSGRLRQYTKEAKEPQAKLDALMSRLKQFSIDHPTSAYADDASYISVLFVSHMPEKYIDEMKLFLYKYPDASLEPDTLNNLRILNPFVKEAGLIDAMKIDMAMTENYLKRYDESVKTIRDVIDNLNSRQLSLKGNRVLGLAYFVLMKNYESLSNLKEAGNVCTEALAKVMDERDKAVFNAKLKQLGRLF